jgi:hypothetical protein
MRLAPELGLSERWSLARNRVGSPIVVIFYASLPAGVISRQDLEHAVSSLLDVYPILRYAIDDQGGRHPVYHPVQFSPEDVTEILPMCGSHGDIINRANTLGSSFDVQRGPLLRVELHRGELRDGLVVYFDHIICDGLGGRNLFSDLLTLLSSTSALTKSTGLPIRMDDTVDLSPHHLVDVPSTYPTSVDGYQPRTAPQVLTDWTLPHDSLTKLMAIGKLQGVPTLQPILHTASLAALHLASLSTQPLAIRTSTPISERNETHGHPRSTGNYVVFHYATTVTDISILFWDEARKYSSTLRKPQSRSDARAALGQLSLLGKSVDALGVGWDEHMNKLADNANGTARLALAISNVGRLELPQKGRLQGAVKDVYFSQSASAVGAAVVLSVSD